MSVVLPVACYPWPISKDQLASIKTAKAALMARDNLDFLIQVREAYPGSPTRVLSFDGPPPFAAETAKVKNWRDPAELQYWLEWCLDPEMAADGFTVPDWIAWQIPGARYVGEEDVDPSLERTLLEGRRVEPLTWN